MLISLCGISASGAASFALLSSEARVGVGASKSRTDRWVSQKIAPSGFTTWDGFTGNTRIATATQSTQISPETGVITSSGTTFLGGGYSGSSTSSLSVSFEIFEPTTYSFSSADVSFKGQLDLVGPNGSKFGKPFNSDSTTGSRSGILDAGVYDLSISISSAALGVPTNSTVVRTSSYDVGLQLGGAAAVPEATEGVCFLAGSLLLVLNGTRRRGQNRRLSLKPTCRRQR